jgi:DNA invertase Pin-like site-specific DNA recombinase
MSKDREGAYLGIDRQLEKCIPLAEQLGWIVVRTYADNDISAYSGKPRPDYLAMIKALDRGEADAVIAWHTDRLHRSPAELEEFIAICDRRKIIVRTVESGELDLSTPAGQMTARIVGAVARHEVDHARSRMSLEHAQAASKGHPHGKIPYGYRAVRDDDGKIKARVPDEEQAPIIREIASRALAGETLYSIAKDLTGRGVPTPGTSDAWRASILAQMMVRPTFAGLRSHHGQITPGTWEPIISIEDHEALVAMIKDASRLVHRGTEPKHLLSGIATCGVCKAPVHRLKSHGYDAYACSKGRCVSRAKRYVDPMIERLVIKRMQRPDALAALAGDRGGEAKAARAEAEKLRGKLRAAALDYADDDGDVTLDMLKAIKSRLQPRIDELDARAKAAYTSPLVGEIAGPNAAAVWKGWTVIQRRELVRAVFEWIRIDPQGGGRGVFDPKSVKIRWADET